MFELFLVVIICGFWSQQAYTDHGTNNDIERLWGAHDFSNSCIVYSMQYALCRSNTLFTYLEYARVLECILHAACTWESQPSVVVIIVQHQQTLCFCSCHFTASVLWDKVHTCFFQLIGKCVLYCSMGLSAFYTHVVMGECSCLQKCLLHDWVTIHRDILLWIAHTEPWQSYWQNVVLTGSCEPRYCWIAYSNQSD